MFESTTSGIAESVVVGIDPTTVHSQVIKNGYESFKQEEIIV